MNGHILNKDYRDMIVCLLDAGVDFMLVGGYAVALHGRRTLQTQLRLKS